MIPKSDKALIELLQSDTPLSNARREFSSAMGRIEQACQQREPLSPIEMRRMEFEAVEKIVEAYLRVV